MNFFHSLYVAERTFVTFLVIKDFLRLALINIEIKLKLLAEVKICIKICPARVQGEVMCC